jgi:hypothetical protein
LEAARGVGQHGEDGGVVGEKSVHEGVRAGHDQERKKTKQAVLHVERRARRQATAYFIEKK